MGKIELKIMSSVLEVLQSIGYSPKDIGTEYQFAATFRGGDNPTAVNVNKKTGLWYDHVSRVGGPLELLVELTLKGKESVDIAAIAQYISKSESAKSDIQIPLKFDKSMLLKLLNDPSYWEGRGISRHTLDFFGGGVAESGRLANRYVFPVFDHKNGNLVGFSGRYLGESKFCPKWKIIGAKKTWAYPAFLNKDIINNKKCVWLVESVGDGISLAEIGIMNFLVLFGVKLNSEILKFLISNDVEKINICLNNDTNMVGNQAASDISESLLSFFDQKQINNKILPFKDLNDMLMKDRKGLIEYVKETEQNHY